MNHILVVYAQNMEDYKQHFIRTLEVHIPTQVNELDSSTLKNLIKNGTQLKDILILLSSNDYSILMKKLGNEYVQQWVTSIGEFLGILHHTPYFDIR